MSDASNIQHLIRFLAQTASIPLTTALALAKPLHAAEQTPDTLAKATPSALKEPLASADPDGKLAKQISGAAKRFAKKRSAGADAALSLNKKRKANGTDARAVSKPNCPQLPESSTDVNEITRASLYTNRAPLLLAFAVILLKHTHPAQPEDSRLSLGMAVVSAGAKAKGRELGVISTKKADAAEELGKGHRSVRVLGRDVPLLRREKDSIERLPDVEKENEEREEDPDTQHTLGRQEEDEEWYWGLDTDAMAEGKHATLPIHTPLSAYSYLTKSFPSAPNIANTTPENPPPSNKPLPGKNAKSRAAADAEDKKHNLELLLGAVNMLFSSWATTLAKDELDRRAWTWYATVRPAVEHGRQGWGGKGTVRLEDILKLRRED